jgi:NACalpha-BTF3-like transcription factor
VYLQQAVDEQYQDAFDKRCTELRKLQDQASRRQQSEQRSSTSSDRTRGASETLEFYQTIRLSVVDTPRLVAEFFSVRDVEERNGEYYVTNEVGTMTGQVIVADTHLVAASRALFYNTDDEAIVEEHRSNVEDADAQDHQGEVSGDERQQSNADQDQEPDVDEMDIDPNVLEQLLTEQATHDLPVHNTGQRQESPGFCGP